MTLTHQGAGNPPEQWEDADNDEDLDDDAPRRRLSIVTVVLAVLVVGASAFLAGVQVQKHHDHGLAATSVATTGTAATTGRTGGGTGTGRGGAGFGGAGATVGQVKLVDGKTIYVTDASGNTVTINTTNASTYTKSQTVTLKDIQPGDTVIIRGAPQTDGSVSATSVTDSGTAGAAGLGGGRGFGAGTGTGTAGTGAAGTGG